MFILFDLRSYNQLSQNKEALKKMFREQLKFTDKDNYILKGCVTSPSYNHFTFYINKLKINDNFGELELNKNYYYYYDKCN